MNILLIGNYFYDKKHNQNSWQDLAEHLRYAGFGVTTSSSKINKFHRLINMLATIWSCRKNYHIAHVGVFSGQAFTWAFLSVVLLKLLKKTVILTLHGGNLPNFSKSHPWRVKNLLTWPAAVVAPSPYLKQELSSFRSDIQLIPNGIDTKQYPFKLRKYPQPKLVWLRAFHQIYNPSLAPKVISLLQDQHIDAHLSMVGPDKGDGSLQEMLSIAQELEVADRISVIRGVSKVQVPEMLLLGDIFLNTTNYDNTPVSVIEAMASGCCIVTTNVGGIPCLLDDGFDALLVPPNDPQAMAIAVKRILTEPGLAESLSANARKKAELFDWSIILPQWEKLLGSLQ